ncbi:hypothetical protein C4577_05215 [Candidatus Parcubacteria bacterium]|nr:MAG: hypothetical protein C4577_05215 [Candidatus Parcubacteria bacterium]
MVPFWVFFVVFLVASLFVFIIVGVTNRRFSEKWHVVNRCVGCKKEVAQLCTFRCCPDCGYMDRYGDWVECRIRRWKNGEWEYKEKEW